jgi:DNA-binding CsgD family transcriptional regulator
MMPAGQMPQQRTAAAPGRPVGIPCRQAPAQHCRFREIDRQQVDGSGKRSRRERDLVARGRTDAEIATQLFISIRTVRSHLDRIRDKTGCRRRADLTRLALAEGLV